MKKMFLEHWFSLLIVFIHATLVFCSTELFSQDSVINEAQLEMPEDLRSTIIIAYDDDLAPLSYTADGETRGILVDIMNVILVDRLGKQVEHRGYSWKRAQLMVKADNADGFCAIPCSVRKRYAFFTASPVIVSQPMIFYGINNPGRSGIDAIGSIEGVRAFSMVDFLGSSWSRETFPKEIQDTIHWVASLDTVFKMLAINRYDIYIGDGIIGRYTLMNLGLVDDVLARTVTVGAPLQYHFGMRKNHPDAQAVIKDVQRTLKEISGEGLVEQIVQGYINPQRTGYPKK